MVSGYRLTNSMLVMENEKIDVLAYLKERGSVVNEAIKEYLNDKTSARHMERLLGRSGYQFDPEALNQSIFRPANYLLEQGGKRWRPILMLTVIDALGKNSADFIEFSVIPEVIHNGTLIHDDIEDSSTMRRGAPAVHVKYGIDVALNLGDFMFYFPVVALLDTKKVDNAIKMRALDIYQRDMLRITIGQATDIAWHNSMVDPMGVSESQYLQMVYAKTGVLSSMAAKLGAVLGGANDELVNALGNFGASIGVAFQLEDDLLNVTESALAKGKGGIGDDITEGKITMMVIYVLEHGNEEDKAKLIGILKEHTRDKERIKDAIAIIKKYKADEYVKALATRLMDEAWGRVDKLLPESPAKHRLKAVSDFLINRSI